MRRAFIALDNKFVYRVCLLQHALLPGIVLTIVANLLFTQPATHTKPATD